MSLARRLGWSQLRPAGTVRIDLGAAFEATDLTLTAQRVPAKYFTHVRNNLALSDTAEVQQSSGRAESVRELLWRP